ncbi:serine/threonine protein kinase [Streptomyces albidocamelliae]|uniref:Serine/threonine protein kinase n=1 Tax=Streptomyces albidocamelliae TaxID=2981135 RepID=A0ABY6EUU3_9ACTN|nr:serine/threonine protein kinase [Streptomyces sp. HUAS 14-6]UXY38177.1 serine/threonine protein kinase [Streptomyces sp. HUAS 14-6]
MHPTGAAVREAQQGPAARRVGPYVLLTGLDDTHSGVPVPERRYIARSDDGEHTVLLGAPLPGADHQRFLAEAETSRYLLGRFMAPATACAGPGEPAWHARPYLPALPLPTVLAVHGGPLPERTVRALGAALAEALAIAHGQGLAHAGVSPAAVLVAADGPRLTCFGAARAAAPEGTPRSGLPGLEPGSLPPEQAAGGRPRPLGDVYALGATLAYAATGHTTPESTELPPALRTIIGRCLSRDPGNRPQLVELLDVCTPESADAPSAPLGAATEAPDAGFATAVAASFGAGWLPGRVIAALAHQSAAVLAADIPRAAPPASRQD